MKLHKFKLGGHVYSACFNWNVLEKLADLAGPRENGEPLDAQELISLFNTQMGLLKGFVLMLREGEAMEGRALPEEINEAWLKSNLSPGEHLWLQRKVAAMYVEGMDMETEIDADEEVDEVLEELKKKLIPGESPSGSSEPGDSSQD